MDQLKKLKAEGHVSEDDIKRHEKEVQEQTDSHVKEINEALEAKEKELLEQLEGKLPERGFAGFTLALAAFRSLRSSLRCTTCCDSSPSPNAQTQIDA